jgi:hypothetical protein
VTLHPTLSNLDDTVTARWRRRIKGSSPDGRSHWRTKVAYYRAVRELLAIEPPPVLSWQTIVNEVRPKGSRSTFYEVTGPHAKHPLIGDLRAAEDVNTIQLALCYRPANAVDQLIAEAKVWSFWPYRMGWLDQQQTDPEQNALSAPESLVSVVADWSRRYPGLAAAVQYAPPVCAVEDLVIVGRRQLSAVRAYSVLSHAVATTVSTPVDLTNGILEAVRADLSPPGLSTPTPDAVLVGLAEQIYAVRQESQRFPPADATAVRKLAAELMRDAVTQLV